MKARLNPDSLELTTFHKIPRRIVDLRGMSGAVNLSQGGFYQDKAFLIGADWGFQGAPAIPWNTKNIKSEGNTFRNCSFSGDAMVWWLFNVYEMTGRWNFEDCDFKHAGLYPGVQGKKVEGHCLYLKATNGSTVSVFGSSFRDSQGNAIQIVNRQKETFEPQVYPSVHDWIEIKDVEIQNCAQFDNRGSFVTSIANPGHNVRIEQTVIGFGRGRRQAGGILLGDAQDRTQRCARSFFDDVVISIPKQSQSLNSAIQLQGQDHCSSGMLTLIGSPGDPLKVTFDEDCKLIDFPEVHAPYGAKFVKRYLKANGDTGYEQVEFVQGVGAFKWAG